MPDLPDQRDLLLAPDGVAALPPAVDLRPQDVSPIYDQGQLGSCTANAISAALRFTLHKEGVADIAPSRLYVYYKERQREGTVNSDSGAMIRDGMKVVATGFIPEKEWPYDISTFASPRDLRTFDQDAMRHHVIKYLRVGRDLGMRACLAAGYPFVMGVSVYQSFEQAKDGHIPMPARRESLLGGHAVLCVGYDTRTQLYTFRNSWGRGWGQKGYGTIPFAYLHSRALASDFWSVRSEA